MLSYKPTLVGLGALLVLTTLACNLNVGGFNLSPMEAGELRTESHVIDKAEITTGQATIAMSAGELVISGGAEELLDATFTYNVDEWTPQISYAAADKQGNLSIRQPAMNFDGIPTDEIRNSWQIKLNDEVPLDLNLELGAGVGELDLHELTLERLAVKAGAGETKINLAGTSVPRLNIDAGVGSMTVDLTGEWQNDLKAVIRSGIGELTVKLPREAGVRVSVSQGMVTELTTRGLTAKGQSFVNEAYGQSPVTLDIELEGGIGQITLIQES